MNTKDKANAFKRLTEDSTFSALLSDVEKNQVDVFLNPNSAPNEREEAHNIIRALTKIVNYIDTILADDIINDRKLNK